MSTPTHSYPINIQLKALIDNGLSIEDAAQCLDLDPDACRHVLTFKPKATVDIDKLIEENQARCVEALLDIGLNQSGEEINPGVRVQALRIILERKGRVDEIGADKLSETYKRMKEVCAGYNKKLETLPLTTKTVTT